jgi:hypothetical protein
MRANFLSENLKGRHHLEHRFRLEDNINIDRNEIDFEGVDWIHLAEDRVQWLTIVKTVS